MFLFAIALALKKACVDVLLTSLPCQHLPTHAGPDMHCGHQQQPAAREDRSVAAELQRRASSHHKPDDEEAGIARNLK